MTIFSLSGRRFAGILAYRAMKTEKSKNKSYLERLAPAYIVLTVLTFAGMLLSNRDNLKFGHPIEVVSWAVIGLIFAVLIAMFDFGRTQERKVAEGTIPASRLVTLRVVYAGIAFVPLCLVLAGFDMSHAIGTYYANHGHADAIYNNSGSLLPSAGTLYILITGLSALTGIFCLAIGKAKIISTAGLARFIFALVVAVPLAYVVLLVNWGANFAR